MKWYENVDMLKEILENISKELEEVEYGSRVWHLLTDENNLIKNHLELIKENQEAVKIATLLKNKKGYIKSQKGNFMELRISNITHNGNKFMVNGYCTYSDNCRYVPLNKVYVSEVKDNEKD